MKKVLKDYREEILQIDQDIFALLSKRAKLAEKIGQIKAKRKLNVEDPTQERRVIKQSLEFAQKMGLEENFSRKVIAELISYSKHLQEKKLPNTP